MKYSLDPAAKKQSYLISIGLHLVLVLIFMLITLRMEPQRRWHDFEWILSPAEPDLMAETISTAGTMPSEIPATVAAPSDNLVNDLSSSAQQVSETVNPSVPHIESPLLESPADTKPGITTDITRDPRLTQALSNAGEDGPGLSVSGSYSSSLIEGGSDAYFLRETKPRINPLMDDVVTVEFALNRNGTVDMSSLNVLNYKRAEHWEALRLAMREWRFGFTGPYNSSKRYRIRCNFTLK